MRVFLTLNVKSGYADEIISKLKAFKEVSLVCLINQGDFDIIAIVDVDTFEEYRDFSVEKIGKLSYIDDYASFITLGV